jgi:hypothetical protein
MIVNGWKVPDDLLAAVTARCTASGARFTLANVVAWLHNIDGEINGARNYPHLLTRSDRIADRLIQQLRKSSAIRLNASRQWQSLTSGNAP